MVVMFVSHMPVGISTKWWASTGGRQRLKPAGSTWIASYPPAAFHLTAPS